MPDAPGQTTSTLAYNSVVTTTTPRNLPSELRQSATGSATKDEYFLSLNTGAVAKVVTFTISGSLTVGDIVNAVVTDADTNAFKYMYEAQTGDTVDTVGQKLATLIGVDDDVTTSAAFATGTSTISVTSVTPGRDFTLTAGKTGTVTVGSVTTATANAGTALKRKLAEVTVDYTATSDGYLSALATIKFYNGASSPSLEQTQTTAPYKHPLSLDAIRTAQGAT